MTADQASTASWWRRQYAITFSPRGCARAAALGAALLGGVAGGVYAARAPILTWIGQQLVDDDPLAAADAIVVLAGGTPAREIEAADLFRAGLAPRVVLPRGPDDGALAPLTERGIRAEAPYALRVRILQELGVPDEAIVRLQPVVESTVAEAREVADWAGRHGIRSLLVVTSAFHTSRAKYTYRRVLERRDIAVRVRAVRVGDLFRADGWWESRAGLTTGLIEWQKKLLYRLAY